MYCDQASYDSFNPFDSEHENSVEDFEVIDDVLPSIKKIILFGIEQGYDAEMVIEDLAWLWSRITDSSVSRLKRAINNQFATVEYRNVA
jgi:hypothetical protein